MTPELTNAEDVKAEPTTQRAADAVAWDEKKLADAMQEVSISDDAAEIKSLLGMGLDAVT